MQLIRGLIIGESKEEKPDDSSDGMIFIESDTGLVFLKGEKWEPLGKKHPLSIIFAIPKK